MKTTLPEVVITGVGLVSPLGNDLKIFRGNLLEGRSGIKETEVELFGKCHAGLCNYDPTVYRNAKAVRRSSFGANMAISCASMAFESAKLLPDFYPLDRIAIIYGWDSVLLLEKEFMRFKNYNFDIKYWHHQNFTKCLPNNPSGELALHFGITGPSLTINASCATGNYGIADAIRMIQLEEVDCALVGAANDCLSGVGILASFKSVTALAKNEFPEKACRPFDLNRNGTVVSEGGIILILENKISAKKRNAPILAEIPAFAVGSDSIDPIIPFSKGQVAIINKVLTKANLESSQIDLINTHATGTIAGDLEEAKAIREIFGVNYKGSVNNTKSLIGHTLAASSLMEIAANISTFEDNLIHPTINRENEDPKCLVPGLVVNYPKRVSPIEYIMKNSFGLLGSSSSIILKRPQQ